MMITAAAVRTATQTHSRAVIPQLDQVFRDLLGLFIHGRHQ
jgi:hypothetical protein